MMSGGWWVLTVALLIAAIETSVMVGRGTAFTSGHRWAAAAAAAVTLLALGVTAHTIVIWYEARSALASGGSGDGSTLAFRRRGLKGAVMGEDGRASTSKTQVALWTGAVVWALVDLLLLARSSPSGDFFSDALSKNWRPEYLVLLGLPVAAAATAKAVVAGSNGGRGPAPSGSLKQANALHELGRAYVRDPAPEGVQGFVTGIAELLTGPDRSVIWADLQYMAFTLITLSYFLAQVLARPGDGLPAVPAALLTLTGVSVAAYTANKVVDTQGKRPA